MEEHAIAGLDNQQFVENIRQKARERGMSISEIENQLGWSQGLISRWARAYPSFERVAALVQLLGITFEELLEPKVSAPPDSQETEAFLRKLLESTEDGRLSWRECDEASEEFAQLEERLPEPVRLEKLFWCPSMSAEFFLALRREEDGDMSLGLYLLADGMDIPELYAEREKCLAGLLRQLDQASYQRFAATRMGKAVEECMKTM